MGRQQEPGGGVGVEPAADEIPDEARLAHPRRPLDEEKRERAGKSPKRRLLGLIEFGKGSILAKFVMAVEYPRARVR